MDNGKKKMFDILYSMVILEHIEVIVEIVLKLYSALYDMLMDTMQKTYMGRHPRM